MRENRWNDNVVRLIGREIPSNENDVRFMGRESRSNENVVRFMRRVVVGQTFPMTIAQSHEQQAIRLSSVTLAVWQ